MIPFQIAEVKQKHLKHMNKHKVGEQHGFFFLNTLEIILHKEAR